MKADVARAIASKANAQLHLPELSKLTPEVATQLATGDFDYLRLDGLTVLDANAAAALAKLSAGVLLLDGLPALTPDVAAALSKSELRWLGLAELKQLDAATASALVSMPTTILHLGLEGLETLPQDAAEALGARPSGLDVNLLGLRHLDDELATRLGFVTPRGQSQMRIQTFDAKPGVFQRFGGLKLEIMATEIDPTQAAAMAVWEGERLSLPNVRRLDAATAAALAKSKADTLILGVSQLDPDAAKALASFAGQSLHLGSLRRLDATTAAALTQWGGEGSSLRLGMLELRSMWRPHASCISGRVTWRFRLAKAF